MAVTLKQEKSRDSSQPIVIWLGRQDWTRGKDQSRAYRMPGHRSFTNGRVNNSWIMGVYFPLNLSYATFSLEDLDGWFYLRIEIRRYSLIDFVDVKATLTILVVRKDFLVPAAKEEELTKNRTHNLLWQEQEALMRLTRPNASEWMGPRITRLQQPFP